MEFTSVNKIFENSFKKNWDRPAISNYRGETLHYKDVARRMEKLHIMFEECGLQKGDKVAILMMNCLEWLPIYFGILKSGCMAVPLNFRYTADEIRYCLNLADADALVFGPEFIERVNAISGDIPAVDNLFFVGK